MSEPENILEVANLKPDLMGFIFYPSSPRDASKTLEPGIIDKLPAGIRKAGVFVNADTDYIHRTVIKYSLDIVQLHGNESPETCFQIKERGIRIIKAFNIRNSDEFRRCALYVPFTDYFLFDSVTQKHGGSGKKFDWGLLEYYKLDHPFFLSGGISAGDQEYLFEINNPAFYGVDLNSRFEIKPGVKSIETLKNFINDIRNKNILI
jgi:phosphoribosylanthranilate isomerase